MKNERPRIVRCPADDLNQLQAIHDFLVPFYEAQLLLERTIEDLVRLIPISFAAKIGDELVGFAAVEIYSRKLAEIQCLAVDPAQRGHGVGQELVRHCVLAAREKGVIELMAISAADALFIKCGFDYSLPNQKKALFISPLQVELSEAESASRDDRFQRP